MSERTASTSVLSSASLNWTIWLSSSGRPNTLRCGRTPTVSSISRSSRPRRDRAPQPLFLELLHLVDEALAFLADRLCSGTFTSSKKICAVSELRMPILSSFFATWTPLVFIGREISDLFLCTGPSPVLASRHIQSACGPLVVHILPPLIT